MARLRRPAPVLATALAALLLAASIVSPAFGGPSLGSLKRSVTRALKLAKAADKRSRQALAAAGKPGPQGIQGPPGPPGNSGSGGSSSSVPVDFRADPGTTGAVIYDRGGLVLTAACTAGPNLDVRATTTVDHSAMHVSVVRHTLAPNTATLYLQKNDFLVGGAPQSITNFTDGSVSATGGHIEGDLTFSTPAGVITSLTFAAEQGAFGGTVAKGCWFGGMAETNAP